MNEKRLEKESEKIRRKILISDIHGELSMLFNLLKKVRFNPEEDQLIVIGDVISSGYNTKSLLEFLSKLQRTYNHHVFLHGNHEWHLMKHFDKDFEPVDSFARGKRNYMLLSFFPETSFFYQAGFEVDEEDSEHFKKRFEKEYDYVIEFINTFGAIFETQHFICSHIGLFTSEKEWYKKTMDEMFENDFASLEEDNNTGKWVFFGHFPPHILGNNLSGIPPYKPLYIDRKRMKIGIDGGAGGNNGEFTQLNAVVLEPFANKEQLREQVGEEKVGLQAFETRTSPILKKDENGEKYFYYGDVIPNMSLKHYFTIKKME